MVFLASSMLVTIVMMNLFIGVLSSAYERARQRTDELFLRVRAGLCCEYSDSSESLPFRSCFGLPLGCRNLRPPGEVVNCQTSLPP